MSDDHEDLADQREHEADALEHDGELLDERVDEAKQALHATHDDALIPTPLGDEDETAQEDTTSDDEAGVVED